MGKMSINLHPEVDGNTVNRVQRALNIMGDGDEITINVESTDAHQADPIMNLLNESGFDYYTKGSHDGKSYYINAHRKPH